MRGVYTKEGDSRFPGVIVGMNVLIDNDVEIGPDTFIGHNVVIRKNTVIGADCMIGHNTVIEEDVRIGCDTRIQAQCYITKHSRVGQCVFIGPMVCTTNDNAICSHGRPEKPLLGVYIDAGARIGARVLLMPGVEVGMDSFVGAGSIVTKSIPSHQLWFGSPAVYQRDVPKEERIYG